MTSVRRLNSRITEIWLSLLLWMHLRPTRKQKRQQEQERLLRLAEEQSLRNQRILLWEALQPVSQAMHRLDQNQQQNSRQHQQQLEQLEEMLMEVLNSLQPSAQEQIFPRIGPHLPTISSHGSGNSARLSRPT